MANYLQGGRILRSKYPRATLDQFGVENEILYLCKKKNDGAILYLLVVPQELKKSRDATYSCARVWTSRSA